MNGRPQPNRLAGGGIIDRAKPLAFQFDGVPLSGYDGDTLASALMASGVKLIGRSFKYHRPRGIFSAGPEEPNALVELRSGARQEPNTKATTTELFDGLVANSQNRWPSLAFDLLSLNQLGGSLLSAGFYYKTFMWPASFWEKVYEPLIRRAAGLGAASGLDDPDRYEKATAFCDVLVIGSGPAGLSAALAAGRAGARVILCEDDFRLGGRLLAETMTVDAAPALAFVEKAEAELASLPQVRLFRRTHVFGVYDGNTYGALEKVADHYPVPPDHLPRQRLWRIVAKQAVNAMGAIERPIAFANNDRPGVMLASAVRTYVNRFAATPGSRAVIFTASDDGWRTASDLTQAGVTVAAIIDPRAGNTAPASAPASAEAFSGGQIIKAHGGVSGVRGVDVLYRGKRHHIVCDLVAVSGGWNPQIGLTTHVGGRPSWNDDKAAFVPGTLPPGMIVAGAASGAFSLHACLAAGAAAGTKAAALSGKSSAAAPLPRAEDEPSRAAAFFHVAEAKGKAFVDLQNDVTVSDVVLAHREGYSALEHLKRYTTLGMATDQGKTGNLIGQALMAELAGKSIAELGTTTARPPHSPLAIGALAGLHRGKHFKATRYLAAHERALAHDAVMTEAGQWLRPSFFPRAGEADWLAAASREARTVRNAVGICDVSTLGKIDIRGPDAALLLDRVYTNLFSTLAVGKARYGLMLRDDGFVMDDGTTARFGEHHYVMSTTTVNASKVMQHLEFCHQALWPELKVAMASVSEQWAQFAVAGPKARDVLAAVLGASVDVSDAALPYMGVAAFSFGPMTARLFRLSFSGERAYELAVPARYGAGVHDRLVKAAADFGGCLYGLEALNIMRIEKGHVAGNELSGRTTAYDLGLHRMLSTKKDFIGRTLAARPLLCEPGRQRLVGLKPRKAQDRLRSGAHILKPGAPLDAAHDEGYITSGAFSPALDSWIALALIAHGPERFGEIVRVYDPVRDGDTLAEIVPHIFVDPKGERVHG